MATKRLVAPDGSEVILDDLPEDAGAVVSQTVTDAIPTTIHGFAVDVGLDSYPRGSKSHRVAMYAKLVPIEPVPRKLCEAKAADSILASVPLTPAEAEVIRREPHGAFAEKAALDACRAAVRLVRRFMPVPRQFFEQRS